MSIAAAAAESRANSLLLQRQGVEPSSNGRSSGPHESLSLHGQGLDTAIPDHHQLSLSSLSFQAVEKLRVRSAVRGRLVSIYRQCLYALKDLNSSGGRGGAGGSPPSHPLTTNPGYLDSGSGGIGDGGSSGGGSKSSSPSLYPVSSSRDTSPSTKRSSLVQALSQEVLHCQQ